MELILNNKPIGYLYKEKQNLMSIEMINHIYELIEKQPAASKFDAYTFMDSTFFNEITDYGINKSKEVFNNRREWNTIETNFWINVIRKNKNDITQRTGRVLESKILKTDDYIWHDHVSLNEKTTDFIPDYTFVYYVQMPDNLKGNDGALFLKRKNEVEMYIYHPAEGDLIILDGDLPHSPQPAFNSTKDRLVIAANVRFSNTKKSKTLL
jgi:hypothetical protein